VNAWAAKNFNERAKEHEEKADEKLKQTNIIITSGDGIKLWVRNGMLILNHGSTHIPHTDKETILNKGVHGVRSIYIQSETGYITLEPLAWTKRQGIEVVVLDMHGSLTFTNITPLSSAKLRRAQYQMQDTGMLEHAAKQIIIKKTTAQLDVLNNLPLYRKKKDMDVIGAFELGIERIKEWNKITDIMLQEGRLANMYWDYFNGLPLKWHSFDKRYTPAHWLYITRRGSHVITIE